MLDCTMILQELAFPSRQEPLLRKKMRPSFLRYCEINIILIKWINRERYEFSKKKNSVSLVGRKLGEAAGD